jgi:GTP-binding protein Era
MGRSVLSFLSSVSIRPARSTGKTSSVAVLSSIGVCAMAMTVAVTRMRDNLIMSPPRTTEKKAGRARRAGAPSGSAATAAVKPQPEAAFRSGFACLVGRPNVGKSTLTNALVGAKVAITSDRPQTTRRVIRGIVHRPDAQLVILDTPGLHRPRTLLGERLDSLVRSTLTEVDVVGFCVPAPDPVGPGDKYLARELAGLKGTPVVAIVTKTDESSPGQVAEQLLAVSALGEWADVVPVSAVAGYQLDTLADVLVSHLPAGPPLYPDGDLTDEPEHIMVAELIREAALEGVRDELPHSIAVLVEEMEPREGRPDLIDVFAEIYVERPSQKAIVIGAKGERMKDVGSRARRQIEALLGARVYLDLHVRIAKDWQRSPKYLRRLGFYD